MNLVQQSKGSISSAATQDEEILLLAWRVHLLRRDAGRAGAVFAAMILAALFGFLLFQSFLFALLGVLLLFFSTADYLLPIHHRLTSRRACVVYGFSRWEIAWKDVRRVKVAKQAVLLSPLPAPSRLDAFRGVVLRFANEGQPGERSALLALLRSLLPEVSWDV